MISILQRKKTFPRGLHPNDQKEWSQNSDVEVLPCPKEIVIPLSQHTGAICEPLVKFKQSVKSGEMIGKSDSFISANVHASLGGICGMQTNVTLPNGRHVPAIPIKVDSESETVGPNLWTEFKSQNWPKAGFDSISADDIVRMVRVAGIAGMGGAAFPTHVKLTRNLEKKVDLLLINGCECEPFLNADYRLMIEASRAVVSGVILAGKALGIEKAIIAIEDNKPLAIQKMKEACEKTAIKVMEVETRYPMGGERQLIFATTGKEVPTGGLPLDTGVVVLNVGTAAAVAGMVLREYPLTHRIVSVSGPGIEQPKNVFVPIGVSYKEVIEFCGGLKPEASRVVAGGPMMGFTLGDLTVPITKGTSGITVLTEKESKTLERTNCVRCGRCVDVCPLHLVPTKIAHAAQAEDWDLAKQYYLSACCECGCCSHICPAGIPLVQLIKTGKSKMPRK